MQANIECRNLSQGYGRKPVIDGLDLALGAGVFGLLGPNGAGKTTLLTTLATIAPPRAGGLWILGSPVTNARDARRARRHIGFLPQGFAFAPRFTVSDFLTYVAWIKEVPRTKTRASVDRVLDRVDLGDQATTRLGALSGGMLQRVGIASALVNDPAVVLLDEPTVGLDPEQRLSFRRLIGDLTDTTVLLSTHLVEDVAAMSSHVLVMAHGSITFSGAVDALHALGSAEPDEFTSPLERGYLAAIAMPATGQRSP